MALTREQYRLIGRNLRSARWRAALQRSEIAKRLGLTESILKAAEHGTQSLTSAEIQILCRIYRIDVQNVFKATTAR
jgi:ribosome-binding protein aMBF1 (putative translation factor)